MKAFIRKWRRKVFSLPWPERRLDDEQLRRALNVEEGHHVLAGVRELIARMEERMLQDLADRELPARATLVEGISALEDLRHLVESWRKAAQAEVEREG